MKRLLSLLISFVFFLPGSLLGSTQQEIQEAIDDGLAYLAASMTTSGDEGYWSYSNDGTLAVTATAVLAFIEEGYLPGTDVEIDGTNYGDVVGKACNYIFNCATADSRFTSIGPGGMETAGYTRYAEDYNNDGVLNDGGNDQAILFDPGISQRRLYTTGIVAPVVYALGKALGPDTVIGRGPLTTSMTYKEVMRDVIDWFSWGQVEPDRGNQRGGWRYDANYSESDNSTAQWAALAIIYGKDWGLSIPQYVKDELVLWTDYIQNDNGGSGYSDESTYVNVAKTGGLLLQFFVLGYEVGVNNSDTSQNNIGNEVDAALDFINSRWNSTPSSTWYGNLNHPYAMWAVYKALQLYGFLEWTDFYPGDDSEFVIGTGMPSAPGDYTIGQDRETYLSIPGDWYSHYCDYLVGIQNVNGSWTGYSHWYGPLATGWYVNLLQAIPVSPTVDPTPRNVRIVVGMETAFLSWTSCTADPVFKIKLRKQGNSFQYYCEGNDCSQNPIATFLENWAVIESLEPDTNYEFKIVAVLYQEEEETEYESESVFGKIPAEVEHKLNNPIMFIPGTGGSGDGWNDMKRKLIAQGLRGGHRVTLRRNDSNQLEAHWHWNPGKPWYVGDFYICDYNEVEKDDGSDFLFHPCGKILENYLPTKLFIDEIRRVEEELFGGKRRVILVGQSLGGLRARAYLQKRARDVGDQITEEKVEMLVTMGTPHLGVLQDHGHYKGYEPEAYRDENENGKWDEGEDYVDTNESGTWDQAHIDGVWRIILGNASEDEEDFFWWWKDDDQSYKFNGGYINDPSRHKDTGPKTHNKNSVKVIMEGLRDEYPGKKGLWDFTGDALLVDLIAGSQFMNHLNYWIDCDCKEGEWSSNCDFSIKAGCESGECRDSKCEYNYLPNIDYRYLVGKNPEGRLHWVNIVPHVNTEARFLNFFMFKNENIGDGFISEKSQDLGCLHLPENIDRADTIPRVGKNHETERSDHLGLLKALGYPLLIVRAKCPVDLSVETPSALIQGWNTAEIPGAVYAQADVDSDGRLDRFIEIPFPEQGTYKVILIPIPGVDPNETYSLEVELDGVVTVIRQDQPVKDIISPEFVYINAPPIASAGFDQTVEANVSGNALVTLDGSASSDPGSTPGTNDDIVSFEWFEDGIFLAEGEIVEEKLAVGGHDILLLVTDKEGTTGEDRVFVTVLEPQGGIVCSTLGNDRIRPRRDLDMFRFYGTEGEIVTLRVEADSPEASFGKLVHFACSPHMAQRRPVALPHEITMTLPRSGYYYFSLGASRTRELSMIRRWWQKYSGDYCVTLEASPETCETLEPYRSVE
ncbi:MAG: hypothetical protein SWE60_01915 [Thermodesulfobacteriota bacterium]|nr:hypothetical protein [Thermodesulfobacteriota bacterium]